MSSLRYALIGMICMISPIASFTSGKGGLLSASSVTQQIVYSDQNGHVHLISDGGTILDKDLTQLTHAPISQGFINAYPINDNKAQIIIYLADERNASNANIHQLLSNDGGETWTDTNVTKLANAPFNISNATPVAYATEDAIQHIVYIGPKGDLHELLSKDMGQSWQDNQPLQNSKVDARGLAVNVGREYVVFASIDIGSTISEIIPGESWTISKVPNLANQSDNFPQPAVPDITVDSVSGESSIFYVYWANNHIHKITTLKSGGQWVDTDITRLAAAPAALSDSRNNSLAYLKVLNTSDGIKHVIYSANDYTIHELTSDKTDAKKWTDSAIIQTKAQYGTNATNIVTAYLNQDHEYILYISFPESHVHEVSKSLTEAQWQDNDLTTLAKSSSFAVSGVFSRCVVYFVPSL